MRIDRTLFTVVRGRGILRSSPYNHSRQLGGPESIESAGVAEPRPGCLVIRKALRSVLDLEIELRYQVIRPFASLV